MKIAIVFRCLVLFAMASAPVAAQIATRTNRAISPEAAPRPSLSPRSEALQENLPATELPALRPDEVLEDLGNPLRIGRVFETDLDSLRDGMWTPVGEGLLWVVRLASPNAYGMRLELEGLGTVPGIEVVVYDGTDPTHAYGPFGQRHLRGERRFWTPTIFSRSVVLELYSPGTSGPSANLRVTGVLQLFPNHQADSMSGGGSCQIDVCTDPDWGLEAAGVARIDYISGGLGYTCSGSILNRLPTDFARIFYTASHCIDSEAEASTAQIYWFYEDGNCDGVDPALSSVPTSLGATLLGSASDPDGSLIGLTDAVPGGLTYLGWDAKVAVDPTDGVIIHHPGAQAKSISYGVFEGIDTSAPCTSADTAYEFSISDGGQSGGSSGAPVFDDAGRVRACVSCSDPGCSPREDAHEGSLAHFFPTVSHFLVPSSDVWVAGSASGVETGSPSQPFDTLIEGFYAVSGDGTIHVVAGTYPPVTLDGWRTVTIVAENGSVIIGG